MRSFGNLNTAVAYARIDNELFELLTEKDSREVLKHTLLEKYFPETEDNLVGYGDRYFSDITNEILLK